ncbi:hypothetical protein M2447_001758 [Ereboglobus sp. PH5-10]|nr:hypothetical protein [Ereboglobus sp. PH5-10]
MKHTRLNSQLATRLAGQYRSCVGICGVTGRRDFGSLRGEQGPKSETMNFVHNINTQGSGA